MVNRRIRLDHWAQTMAYNMFNHLIIAPICYITVHSQATTHVKNQTSEYNMERFYYSKLSPVYIKDLQQTSYLYRPETMHKTDCFFKQIIEEDKMHT